jgi:hypothetical protein
VGSCFRSEQDSGQQVKVHQLIEKLKEMPQDKEVLFRTPDDWFYDCYSVDEANVSNGREDEDGNGEGCVYIC